jgi:predicted TIM-barrel fold metal-dependent hydrolase
VLGLSLPERDLPRVGWRERAPGVFDLWAIDAVTTAPYYQGRPDPDPPVLWVEGHVVKLRRREAGDPGSGAGWFASFDVSEPPALLPVWITDGRVPPPDARPYVLGVALARMPDTRDVHAHIGHLNDRDYPPEIVSALLAESHIKAAWVSNLDGASVAQEEANAIAAARCRGHDGLKPVFWANPAEGKPYREVSALLERGGFVGLKFHPELNGYDLHDPRVTPYLEKAAELGLFALFHTDIAERSRPEKLAALAAKHPRVKFVAGHMGLWGAQAEALAAIAAAEHQNIWGDLAWFHRFDLLAVEIARGRTTRFVFGSDAPVDGEESHQQYLWVLWRMGADETLLRALFVENPRALEPGAGA